MEVLDLLNNLDIIYDKVDHKAVFTSDEAQFIKNSIDGVGVKNLFLKDNKDRFYVMIMPDDKRADLKKVRKFLGVSNLSFGSEDKLMDILGLVKGSVTPLGIINDKDNKVVILIDKDLVGVRLLVHPNVNTSTISLEYNDFIKFVDYLNHKYVVLN